MTTPSRPGAGGRPLDAPGPGPAGHAHLPRELGVGGAITLGLGSTLGSGIFVAVALAAEVTGSAVLAALVIAAVVASFNALSSAQLAAEHPVSGGTYAYGYRHLHPLAGFTAGWVFLLAKGLSAAVAAIGAAAYLLHVAGLDPSLRAPVAAGLALAVTALAAGGLRRSARGNALLVGITVAALAAFVVAGTPTLVADGASLLDSFWTPPDGDGGPGAVLWASALMFVAFAGYARVATLGEEIRDPARNLPRAILATVGISLLLYLAVTAVALGVLGPAGLAGALDGDSAPLAVAAGALHVPLLAGFVAMAAVTALLGVLLNLVLGLSRVLLAMARRGDMPGALAHVAHGRTPRRAVLAAGAAVAVLAAVVRIGDAWSIGAFAVLVYYALTNAAALRLPAEDRLCPRWTAWAGLVGTTSLAAFIAPVHLAIGVAMILVGAGWHFAAGRVRVG